MSIGVYQAFYGYFYIAQTTFYVTGSPFTIPAGWYYLDSYDGDTTGFLRQFQAKIRAVGAGWDASTVTINRATRRVVFNFESDIEPFGLDSTLQALLGMPNNQTGFTVTGTSCPQHTWFPSLGMTDFPLEDDGGNFWNIKSQQLTQRSLDGKTSIVPRPKLYDAICTWSYLQKAETITPTGGTIYKDFQNFFTTDILNGYAFKFQPDASKTTSADFLQCVMGADGKETIGSFLDFAARYMKSYNGLWNVRIPLMKDV